MSHWRLAKNAVANLGRGGAAAVVALVLPPILVRHMEPAAFAVWVLVLQLCAYISFLNLGLQTAIGRYVAYANEKQDEDLRDSVFSTGLVALCCAALLAIALLLVAVVFAPTIFPKIPHPLIPQMRLALLIVGITMAVELPASACNGVFVGLQRYEIPALTVGGARLIWAVGITVAAIKWHSLVLMAMVIGCANFLSYAAQFLALRRFAPSIRFKPQLVRMSTARELASYCFGLTVMSFSMLLVSGFDLVLVGHFDFSAVTPYSVAASLITFISGLQYAIVNVLMPHATTLHARDESVEMGNLVISSTRISVLILIFTGVPILIYAAPILRIWIGSNYVAPGTPLLVILVVANIIRLVGGPYSVVLIAAGQQSYVKVSPLVEGISNFVASVALGYLFGGVGVALGTLFGSIVGVASLLLYSMAQTRKVIAFSRRRFLRSSVFVPLIATSPLLLEGVLSVVYRTLRWQGFVLATASSMLISGAVLFRTRNCQRLILRSSAAGAESSDGNGL